MAAASECSTPKPKPKRSVVCPKWNSHTCTLARKCELGLHPRVPCMEWQLGVPCKYGLRCRKKHPTVVCKFQDRCFKGPTRCMYKHIRRVVPHRTPPLVEVSCHQAHNETKAELQRVVFGWGLPVRYHTHPEGVYSVNVPFAKEENEGRSGDGENIVFFD